MRCCYGQLPTNVIFMTEWRADYSNKGAGCARKIQIESVILEKWRICTQSVAILQKVGGGSLEMAGNRGGAQLLLQTDKLLPWRSPGIALYAATSKISWTICRILVSPFVVIVKAGQLS